MSGQSPESTFPIERLQAESFRDQLAVAVENYAASPGESEDRILFFTYEIKPVNLLVWLSQLSTHPRFYFSARDGATEFAGIGVEKEFRSGTNDGSMVVLRSVADFTDRNATATGLCLFGGCCFDPSNAEDDLWSDFPTAWFCLPQMTVSRYGEKYFATAAIRNNRDSSQLVRELVRRFDLALRKPEQSQTVNIPALRSREETVNCREWDSNIRRVIEAIEGGKIKKVVLARRVDLQFDDKIDPVAVVQALKSANSNSYCFLFDPAGDSAFVGATPERLFCLQGYALKTEAIAGSAPVAKSDRQTKTLAEQLLASEKDCAEHQYVVDYLSEKLMTLCSDVDVDPQPELLLMRNVQHLLTRLQGTLKQKRTFPEVIELLHPTPAVAGTPQERALTMIRELEPFSRGWYAGPVGIVTGDQVEMVVAIRSGLIKSHTLSLYAGAGIVAGSESEQEWNETEQKLAVLLEVFSGN